MTQVFLDLDGVLVDFISGACKHHGVTNPYLNPVNHGQVDLAPLLGMSNEAFWGGMGYDFWANLPWLDTGREILKAIYAYVPIERITILTSPIQTPGCAEGKIAWIKNNLYAFRRKFFVGPPKEVIAAPGKLLIDDFDKNVDKWQVNGPVIQVPALWNRFHAIPTVNYVKAQLEIYFANDHD